MTPKAIFFDFDGTLADTAPGILRTMEETFKALQMPVPAADDMRATIGLPLPDALGMLGHLSHDGADEATTVYRRLFPTFEATMITIFPGVPETLQWLAEKDLRMAIVTSRGADSLRQIVSTRGIGGFFEQSVTLDDGLTAKPAPDMVNALLQRMSLSKDEVMVVGDTTFDIEMGNRAGCRTVAVTYGNHSRELLESVSPTFIIDSFEEMKGVVAL